MLSQEGGARSPAGRSPPPSRRQWQHVARGRPPARAKVVAHAAPLELSTPRRALQVALVPATKRAEKILHDFSRKAKVPPLHAPTAHAASEALKQLQLAGLGQLQHVLLAYRVTLEGEQLQALLLRFLSLAAAWLLHLGETEGAPAKFALLPEACVTGICELLIVTARTAPQRLAGHPAAAAIVSRFCCDWLGRRELLASPFVRYTMADVLSTLIEADSISRQSGHGAMRLFDLVDAPAAERVQAPLMGLYVELGLHTNASAVTDKNGQRYNLMRVLRKLWEMPRAWQQLQSLARQSVSVPAGEQEAGSGSGSGGGSASSAGAGTGAPSAAQVASFGEFCSTLVKEMIFLLDDALGRLTDVKSRQDEMTDEVALACSMSYSRHSSPRRTPGAGTVGSARRRRLSTRLGGAPGGRTWASQSRVRG